MLQLKAEVALLVALGSMLRVVDTLAFFVGLRVGLEQPLRDGCRKMVGCLRLLILIIGGRSKLQTDCPHFRNVSLRKFIDLLGIVELGGLVGDRCLLEGREVYKRKHNALNKSIPKHCVVNSMSPTPS
jgi:hypothetical protein